MNPLLRHDLLVRWLHPVAWWIWAVSAAIAASSTTNPLLLVSIAAAALLVVINRGARAPWAASISMLLKFAALLVGLRVVFQSLLGAPIGTHVIAHLPSIALPSWMSGIRVGGLLTLESLLLGTVEGLRFAAILICIAAATALAAPSRLFRALPSRAAAVGTLLIVAMTMVPHLVADFRRISAARRLRGRRARGIRAITASLTPVLDGALDRSMQLAASMFSRGYGSAKGRSQHRADPWRLAETFVGASGIVAASLTVAIVASSTSGSLSLAPLRWPELSPFALLAVALIAAPAWATPRTPPTDAVEA